MFDEGNIIYFDPFYFKNGNTAKPKYFIVLKLFGQNSVLAALPTRKDSIPADQTITHGCIELPEINLNCYLISNEVAITACGKQFDFKTHIYGYQLDDYSTSSLQDMYRNEGTDYVIWGKVRSDIFSELIDCLKHSRSVKMKYKRLL